MQPKIRFEEFGDLFKSITKSTTTTTTHQLNKISNLLNYNKEKALSEIKADVDFLDNPNNH